MFGLGLCGKQREKHRVSGCKEEEGANSNRGACGTGEEGKRASFSGPFTPEPKRSAPQGKMACYRMKGDVQRVVWESRVQAEVSAILSGCNGGHRG